MTVPLPSRIPLRLGDLDILGHVNNACYLTYFEEARISYLQQIGIPSGAASPRVVARFEIDYLRPVLRSHGEVEVGTSIERLGNRSFVLLQEVRTVDELHARGRSVIVAFDMGTQRSREFSDVERAALSAVLAAQAADRVGS